MVLQDVPVGRDTPYLFNILSDVPRSLTILVSTVVPPVLSLVKRVWSGSLCVLSGARLAMPWSRVPKNLACVRPHRGA